MFFLTVIAVIIVFCVALSRNDSPSTPAPSPARPTPPPVKRFDENNPDDIIKVIGLLAECVANKTDTSFYVVFENDNRNGDNRRIIINACIDDWGDRFKTEKGPSRWCWIEPEGAAFLDTVPFTFDGDNVNYTYFMDINKPILYKNRGFSAVRQGVARARFANGHDIRIEETGSSINIFCL